MTMQEELEFDYNNIQFWTQIDVNLWLCQINYENYAKVFEKNSINGQALLMLTDTDLKEIVKKIGDRKNILYQINKLQKVFFKQRFTVQYSGESIANHFEPLSSSMCHDEDEYKVCESCLKKVHGADLLDGHGNFSIILKTSGEKRKTFISFIYCVLIALWTSFVLTIVHNRVPSMQKYPPLPDIILDNVPLMPWAFYLTEIIILVLGVIMLTVLLMHRYRYIILRRMYSLAGSIFLLRSITMLITSLSVPGIHIQCSGERYNSLTNQIKGAFEILCGLGLSIKGVRTCGDYMFSGHSVCLTLLTHFICEYTPYTMNWLHTFVWILNVFGLFFILAGHEHYSIDVFIAFYISSRLFMYYHSLANNKVLMQRDRRRVKIWFPLFSYFEENINSVLPNEYENPINSLHDYLSEKFRKLLQLKKKKI